MRSASVTFLAACAFALSVFPSASAQDTVSSSHAIAMFGDIKYPPDFAHFDYVNPSAPKGGSIRLASIGTYDSLNPFIIKGVPAAGIGAIYDTLLTSSSDEPFTEYGLLVETIDMPEDRSWVAFTLREGARWHDGVPVTADDVIYSFELLTTKGNPFYRSYYGNVEVAEKTGERTVRFTFSGKINRELPLIIGQMAVLPKHYWETRDFGKTTLDPPLGSGPYRVEAVDPGRSITYRRVEDYWGKDLAVNVGRNNIDVIRYDYYRDATVSIEALKAHEYDFRAENISKEWATAYEIPDVAEGKLVKELVPHELGTGMQGFAFNARRAKFADPRVRRALAYAFDFEWTNTNLFYGQYTRTKSYFSNTELASSGLPEGLELDILERFRGRVPDEVFTTEYQPPATDGSGNLRENLLTARALLAETGWQVRDGTLTNAETGEPLEIEFLLVSPSFERIVGPVVENIKRLGVKADIRIVDPAQYQNRLDEYDFDIIVNSWGQSLSPGNEQRDYWSSAMADTPGTRNYAGIKDPAIDALIEELIAAPDRATLVATTRALDRVLLWGHYVIPHWHIQSFRLVYWNIFGKPEVMPRYGLGFPAIWWVDEDKSAVAVAEDAPPPEDTPPLEDMGGDKEPAEPLEIVDQSESDDNLSIWLAFAGFSLIALMAWLRRKRVK